MLDKQLMALLSWYIISILMIGIAIISYFLSAITQLIIFNQIIPGLLIIAFFSILLGLSKLYRPIDIEGN